jgi:hypothetical protein
MPFELILDGHTYNTDELSVAEAVELEKALGKTWGQLNPLKSAEEFQAFAAICLRRDHPAEQAAKIAAELPLGEALSAGRWISDDRPTEYEDGFPKAEGGPSTTTSSTSRGRRGAGRPTSSGGKPSAT